MGKKTAPKKTSKPSAAFAAARRGRDNNKKKTSLPYPAIICCLLVAVFSYAIMKAPRPTDNNNNGSINDEQNLLAVQQPQKSFPCDETALSNFLQDDFMPGFHVVCIHANNSDAGDNSTWKADIYAGGKIVETSNAAVNLSVLDPNSNEVSWPVLQSALKTALDLRTTDRLHQPWALYNPIGERIVEENQNLPKSENQLVMQRILDSRMFFIFEGGQWVWPGVRVGYKRTVDLFPIEQGAQMTPNKETATIETLSLRPLVLSVEGFLADGECDHIQRQATPRLEYSKVLKNDKISSENTKDAYYRTSQQASLAAAGDMKLMLISDRTASLVRTPRSQQERLQVLRYGLGEKYDAHTDSLRAEAYKNNPTVLEHIGHGRKNRFATVFWYMSGKLHYY